MTCALCHVSFNPNRPPADVHEPNWDNIVSNIGNQYFREGNVFGSDMPHDSYIIPDSPAGGHQRDLAVLDRFHQRAGYDLFDLPATRAIENRA